MRRLLILVLLFGAGSEATAAELGSSDELLSVEVHAFVSQGFIKTTDNNYLAKSQRGSFEFTEAGINFSKDLTDRMRLGLQLFSRKLGPLGDYNAKFDWFYLDYRWEDWLGFRAGRVKLPFGLYNEINDVDSARVPILLPQSVYPTQNRDFLLAQTGAEFYGRVDIRSVGALEYALYGGTIFLETANAPNSPIAVEDLNVPYVTGGRLLWETPIDGLRLGGSAQALRLDTKLLYTATQGQATVKIPAVLWVGSIEYLHRDLLLAAEYSRWHVRVKSSDPMLFPESSTVSERGYVLATYRLNRWFQPSLYYSVFYPDVDKRSGRANMQHDVAATLRFDVNPHWLFKLEGHYMRGTAGLSPTLNSEPLDKLTRDWGVLLVKTTAYF